MHTTTPAPCPISPTLSRLTYFDEEFKADGSDLKSMGWTVIHDKPNHPAQYPCRMAPSNWMILHNYNGRKVMRRVYITCFSNSGSFFVKMEGKVYGLHDWNIPGNE